MTAHWSTRLPEGACQEAVGWCRTQPSAAAAWRNCPNFCWMLWLLRQNLNWRWSAKYINVDKAAWGAFYSVPSGGHYQAIDTIHKHFPRPPRLPA